MNRVLIAGIAAISMNTADAVRTLAEVNTQFAAKLLPS